MMQNLKIVIDPFCFRQFDINGNTSQYIDCTKEYFTEQVNKIYKPENLKDGYAPFCKHLFIENFTQAKVSTIEINQENQQFIKSEYEARTEKELPVLKRFIPKECISQEKAKYLDVILYSKDQVQKENQAMGNIDPNANVNYEYGVVSIKPQNIDLEIPMDPITMMRNALGKEHGGSGVDLDREKYKQSVYFWSKHILIK